MPPRKKGNTSKKQIHNHQDSQPSKFGIQHFFDRHTQNSLSQKVKQPDYQTQNPKNDLGLVNQAVHRTQNPTNQLGFQKKAANGSQNPKHLVGSEKLADQSPRNLLGSEKLADNVDKNPRNELGLVNQAFNRSENPRNDLGLEKQADNQSLNPRNLLGLEKQADNGAPKGKNLLGPEKLADNGTRNPRELLATEKRADNVTRKTSNVSNLEKSTDNVASNHRSELGFVTVRTKNEQNLGAKEVPIILDDTPPDCQLLEGDPSEVTPEICKSVKRFKFSPGMLIEQSQDDGGDMITWENSPVNDRLDAVSKKKPEMVRVLAESSRLNSLNFQRCQLSKDSPKSPAEPGKWLSTPPLKPHKTAALSNKVGLKRVKPSHDINMGQCQESLSEKNDSCITRSQSTYRTPPSSYCLDKCGDDPASGVIDQPCSRKQKKHQAFIELLDQVLSDQAKDVITGDESDCSGPPAILSKVQNAKGDGCTGKIDPAIKSFVSDVKVNVEVPDLLFLVLEVSEKRGAANSTGFQRDYKVLRLLNEQSGEERAAHLWDDWFFSIVAPGDTVHVIGNFDDGGKCDVNRDSNYLIVHPDLLMSGSRVAASFSCSRRSVLDERLKCGEQSVPALTGTLLHQIFQAGLTRETLTKEFLEEYATIVLQKNMESLYACGVNENDMHKLLIEAIPKMLNWIFLFRDSQDTRLPTVNFGCDHGLKNLKISEVTDIEEMAWAPKYGLKGMFDASLRVRYSSSTEAEETIMPLEFKTGKGTSGQTAVEHGAQVMLYTLLMSERYLKTIDRGILYYLHTDQTQGIAVHRSDLVGLIMRRNELANDILKASITQQLPPMLRSPSMCKGCRHLNICTIYHKAHGGSKEGSGLADLFDSLVQHLTNGHYTFLRQWERLIDLEAMVTQGNKKDIRGSSSLQNEKSSTCLSSIVLDTSEEFSQLKFSKGNRFIYRFVRRDSSLLHHDPSNGDSLSSFSSPVDDINCALKSGDYVVLTAETMGLVVASGAIVDISRSHVKVSFPKRLRLPASSPASLARDLGQEVWRIDKDESMTLFAVMRFNLVQLFLQSEHSFHLRRMIVDLEAPRFDSGCSYSQDPAISYIWSEKNLNNDQRRAIIKILSSKDYTLILGMPGTGKTSTMVYAVKALLMRGASILLTSYTNSAVDNLLIKLKAQEIDFVRIGRTDAVHKEVRGNCFSEMNIQRVDEIKARLDQIKVVAVTCLGITSPLLVNKRFDVCIMDEAGQTTLPVSLGPLMYASKFVLVGDHYQLPPLVQSTEALENGMGVSLFCRLSEAHPQAISALQSQYRMCAGIMQLSNALIYGNRLRCGSPEVENSKLKFTSTKYSSLWLKEILDPNKAAIFVNTDTLPAFESKDGKTVNNPLEAKIIAKIAEELVSNGIGAENIGVITPYNSQANLIRHAVSISVEIHTIDKYQGRDKDCILISFVRSTDSPRNCISSLLGDWHRINVALTRAKRKLIMVGSCKTLSKVPLLKLMIEKVEEQSRIVSLSPEDINQRELKRCSTTRFT